MSGRSGDRFGSPDGKLPRIVGGRMKIVIMGVMLACLVIVFIVPSDTVVPESAKVEPTAEFKPDLVPFTPDPKLLALVEDGGRNGHCAPPCGQGDRIDGAVVYHSVESEQDKV